MNWNRIIVIVLELLCFTETCFAQWDTDYMHKYVISNSKAVSKQFNKDYSVYIIRDTIDLRGNQVQIPNYCVLQLEKGTIINGKLIFNNTRIEGEGRVLCEFSGTICNTDCNIELFGITPSESLQQGRFQQVLDLYSHPEIKARAGSWDIRLDNTEPRILLKHGSYNFGNIKIRGYVTIEGEGKANTILNNTSFECENGYNINIRDLCLFGNRTVDKEHGKTIEVEDRCAIKLVDCGRVTLERLTIRYYDIGCYLYNTICSNIDNCIIDDCSIGFVSDGDGNGLGCHSLCIQKGGISKCTYGIVLGHGFQRTVSNLTLEHNIQCAIFIKDDASSQITGNYFEDNRVDVLGDAVTVINIDHNYFESGKNTNIQFETASYVNVDHNFFGEREEGFHINVTKSAWAFNCMLNDFQGNHKPRFSSNVNNIIRVPTVKTVRKKVTLKMNETIKIKLPPYTTFGTLYISLNEKNLYGKVINVIPYTDGSGNLITSGIKESGDLYFYGTKEGVFEVDIVFSKDAVIF